MTKKEAKALQEAWRKTLADGRVVRFGVVLFNDGMEFRSFPTTAAAEKLRLMLRARGVDATIVHVGH